MMLIAKWVVNAIALFIVSRLIPGILLDDFVAALFAVVVISLVNALIRPVIVLLTLPINFLTLGLFTFIINAVLLMLAAALTPGFAVTGLGAALLGSILLSIVSMLLNSLIS